MSKLLFLLFFLSTLNCKHSESKKSSSDSYINNANSESNKFPLMNCINNHEEPNLRGENDFWRKSLGEKWAIIASPTFEYLKFKPIDRWSLVEYNKIDMERILDRKMGVETSFSKNDDIRGVFRTKDGMILKSTQPKILTPPMATLGYLIGECLGAPKVNLLAHLIDQGLRGQILITEEALPGRSLENSDYTTEVINKNHEKLKIFEWLKIILPIVHQNSIDLGVDFQFMVANPDFASSDPLKNLQIIDTSSFSIRSEISKKDLLKKILSPFLRGSAMFGPPKTFKSLFEEFSKDSSVLARDFCLAYNEIVLKNHRMKCE